MHSPAPERIREAPGAHRGQSNYPDGGSPTLNDIEESACDKREGGKPIHCAYDPPVPKNITRLFGRFLGLHLLCASSDSRGAPTNRRTNHLDGRCAEGSRAIAVGTAHKPVPGSVIRAKLYIFTIDSHRRRAKESHVLCYFGAVHVDEF
jgi:hypothetical protein